MNSQRSFSRPLCVYTLLALLPLASSATDVVHETDSRTRDPLTHELFTGTDIRVVHKGAPQPVQGVDGDAFVIQTKDKSIRLPIERIAKKIVLNRTMMLTDRSATVTNLKHERAYTPANDPYKKASEGMLNAAALGTKLRETEQQLRAEPTTITVVDSRGNQGSAPNPLHADLQQQVSGLQSHGNMNTIDTYAGSLADELARELFDALDLEFEISAEQPIQSPYIVVTAEYHTKEEPTETRSWLFARALDPIDSTPRKVSFREGGFRPGFVLEKLNVDLYENGEEIATDLCDNRVSLTRAEAHEYLVIDHINTHKGETMPARLILPQAPGKGASSSHEELLPKTYYVKVDAKGLPTGAFEDEACRHRVTEAFPARVLDNQLFLPALNAGRPIDSVVRIQLRDLSR